MDMFWFRTFITEKIKPVSLNP